MILAATMDSLLPTWAQILIGASLVLMATVTIWKKLVRPAAKMIARMDEMIPLLTQMTEQFRDTPHAFAVLDDIIREFRTDSGSTLRDVVNRLEEAAKENKASAEVLKVNVQVAKELAEEDRKQIQRMVLVIDRVYARAKLNTEGVDRLESGAAVVARELGAAQNRADQVADGEPGAAADAAVQSDPKTKQVK